MKRILSFLVPLMLLIATSGCGAKNIRNIDERGALPRVDASSLGIDTSSFHKVADEVFSHGSDELHSLMVLKDGKVIYEKWYAGHSAGEPHVMWSVSKTFTATAVGFAVQEGLLKTSDRVLSFFGKDEIPAEPSLSLLNLTVEDLLTMSSGFDKDLAALSQEGNVRKNIAAAILSYSFAFIPGERFRYTNANTYLLSVILQRVTGQKVGDYLQPRLFGPLGITEWTWDESEDGYNFGAWGLHLTTESMAKMGQFILQEGVWNGKRLLPRSWFRVATAPHIMQYKGRPNLTPAQVEAFKDDDWNCGYAYQMWNCRHGAVRMDGARGQEVFIIPDCNAVVVMTAFCNHLGSMFGSMWDNIYPNL